MSFHRRVDRNATCRVKAHRSEPLHANHDQLLAGSFSNGTGELAGADLRGLNLTGAQLDGQSLIATDLSESVLNGADLSDADLSAARLVDAVLEGVHCLGTKFDNADLRRSRFLLDDCIPGVFSRRRISPGPICGGRAWRRPTLPVRTSTKQTSVGIISTARPIYRRRT